MARTEWCLYVSHPAIVPRLNIKVCVCVCVCVCVYAHVLTGLENTRTDQLTSSAPLQEKNCRQFFPSTFYRTVELWCGDATPSHSLNIQTKTKWKALLRLSEDTCSFASSVASLLCDPQKVSHRLWFSYLKRKVSEGIFKTPSLLRVYNSKWRQPLTNSSKV